jgi:gliding motility-associated-like protein
LKRKFFSLYLISAKIIKEKWSYTYIWNSLTKFNLIKKIYIVLFLLWSAIGVAQGPPPPIPININNAIHVQSFYGPEQLIEEVLIDSPCSTVSNFSYQVSGNPGDNTTKSYGYFSNTGNGFPFEAGIVITSGHAYPGGNIPGGGLVNFQNNLPGDADLDAYITSTPGTTSNDATFISFTFTPIADTISFRYLMASEEYGTFECDFTDSFAFLLREVGTTTYTNLAVLADGTEVTVTNINNNVDPTCNSNPDQFAGYNLIDTHYGGRTKALTAFANVTPNVSYEIKLVVADEGNIGTPGDQQYDTAIFLEAGSFNIGLDLGEDLTISGGNSICSQGTLTLDTLIPTTTGTHTWYQDGVEIAGATDSFLDVTVNGEYTVIVDFSGSCTATDTVVVEFATSPVLNPIADQLICDNNNDGFWALDLNALALQVLDTQNPSDFTVTFHVSQTDADGNSNPLSSPYTNTVGYGQEEIFIRIESNINTNCYATDSFIFDVADQPTATAQSFALCDNDDDGDDTNGYLEFDLATLTPLVLNGQNSAQFTVTYHLNQADADTAAGALPLLYTNSTPNAQQLIVRVENIDNTDCYETASIDLIVYELPAAAPFVELFQCDDDIDGYTEFNLTEANETISANYTTEVFTYHLTLSDAQANSNALTNPTTYTNLNPSAAPDILYVRIETTEGCYRTTQLNLIVSTTQIPPNFQLQYEVCDDAVIDGDYRNGIATFDFSDADAQISAIFVQTITITYYETLEDALAETNAITDTSNFRNDGSPNNQTIFVRVENDADNSCIGLGEHITLTVNQLPDENDVADIELCSDTADIATIDLSQFDAEVIGSQIPVDFTITYHEAQSDADSGTNVLTSPYTTISNPQTIYVRVENNASGCFVSTINFEIGVNTNPVIGNPTALELCDDNNPGDQIEAFNLEDSTNEILGSMTGVTLTFHESLIDADSAINTISSPYSNISNPQTVYARVEDDVTGCYSTTTLDLIVNALPISNTDPNDLILCDDDNPGNAIEIFDLTLNEAYIIDGEVGVTATYYESFADAENTINTIATPTDYANTSTPQTIFVRITNDTTGCFVIVDFDLIVNSLPDVNTISDLIACEDNTDEIFNFDLESKTVEVLNGQDPGIFNVSYHESQADADASINALVSPYTNTSNPQQIFVNITNTNTGCDVTAGSFFIQVQESSNANQNMMTYTICDSNTGDNDGLAQFDLATRDAEVLDGQDPLDYEVTYYATFDDADLYINQIPTIYENVTNTQLIYARVDNINTPDSFCYAITEITLQVDLLPNFDLADEYILCVNTNGTEVVGPPLLDTGLSEADYDFEWRVDGAVITDATSSSYLALQGGNYTVLVTNSDSGCQNTDTAIVTESDPPIVSAVLTTVAFTDSNVIKASATGTSVYEFSLDNGPWQDSGIFENVSAGEHVVKARDLNGCGIGITTILVIDYPHYFTPNGDGYHDTWNIVGIETQTNAKIYIFDRYGKLLKQLSPTGSGWNGTFMGALLPTNDYWFTVEYDEPKNGERKLFKAHFTLKR